MWGFGQIKLVWPHCQLNSIVAQRCSNDTFCSQKMRVWCESWKLLYIWICKSRAGGYKAIRDIDGPSRNSSRPHRSPCPYPYPIVGFKAGASTLAAAAAPRQHLRRCLSHTIPPTLILHSESGMSSHSSSLPFMSRFRTNIHLILPFLSAP